MGRLAQLVQSIPTNMSGESVFRDRQRPQRKEYLKLMF